MINDLKQAFQEARNFLVEGPPAAATVKLLMGFQSDPETWSVVCEFVTYADLSTGKKSRALVMLRKQDHSVAGFAEVQP